MPAAFGECGEGGPIPPFPAVAEAVKTRREYQEARQETRSFRRTGGGILWRCLEGGYIERKVAC